MSKLNDDTTPLTEKDAKELAEFLERLKSDPNVDQNFLKYREKQMRQLREQEIQNYEANLPKEDNKPIIYRIRTPIMRIIKRKAKELKRQSKN